MKMQILPLAIKCQKHDPVKLLNYKPSYSIWWHSYWHFRNISVSPGHVEVTEGRILAETLCSAEAFPAANFSWHFMVHHVNNVKLYSLENFGIASQIVQIQKEFSMIPLSLGELKRVYCWAWAWQLWSKQTDNLTAFILFQGKHISDGPALRLTQGQCHLEK